MSKPTAYLVTGGSAGIGAAIVRMLLDAGHQVVNIDYKLPENPPAGLVSYQADLTDEARTKEVAAEVTAAYSIVGLVNNAGATRPGTADTATLADLDYVVNLHLRTALILVQAALPAMREAGFGRIVNMSSRAALGKPDRVVYSATKAGLVGMTRLIARAGREKGVRAAAILPGFIGTEMIDGLGARAMEPTLQGSILPRAGEPEEVAELCAFLASAEASYLDGAVVPIDGGFRK